MNNLLLSDFTMINDTLVTKKRQPVENDTVGHAQFLTYKKQKKLNFKKKKVGGL